MVIINYSKTVKSLLLQRDECVERRKLANVVDVLRTLLLLVAIDGVRDLMNWSFLPCNISVNNSLVIVSE